MLTKQDAVRREVPPAFRDYYVVRCLEAKSAPNKKQNPMVTSQWEIVGKPNSEGGVDTEIERDGIKYQVAGLRTQPLWNVLTAGRPLNSYIRLWEAVNGREFEGVDPENPDISWLSGAVLLLRCSTVEDVVRRELTDEERIAKKARNEPLLGEPLLKPDGTEQKTRQAKIDPFDDPDAVIEKFTGNVPAKPF